MLDHCHNLSDQAEFEVIFTYYPASCATKTERWRVESEEFRIFSLVRMAISQKYDISGQRVLIRRLSQIHYPARQMQSQVLYRHHNVHRSQQTYNITSSYRA